MDHVGSFPYSSYWKNFPYDEYNISDFWRDATYDQSVLSSYGLNQRSNYLILGASRFIF